jgi:dTDP-4-amino-4,6-dideoxygalactose transaminase
MKYLLSDMDVGEEEAQAVAEVVRSKWLSIGPRTAEFEAAFADYFEVRHAIAVSSCTAALHLALIACKIRPGDEIILPSLTFVATANAVLYQGATPVFADITSQDDLNIDVADIERRITEKTAAIIVVHYAGYAANMGAITRLAKQYGIPVIEDACHAIGARYELSDESDLRHRRVGTIGKIGCFSFFANKNLSTGEGGMLVTNDDHTADAVRRARAHGMTKTSWDRATGRAVDYDVVDLGYNYRPTEITAALGLIQLRKLQAGNQQRKVLTHSYREALSGQSGFSLPFAARSDDSAYHIMPLILQRPSDRQEFRQRLQKRGIQTSIHYPPVHLFTQYQKNRQAHGALPVTMDVTAREVTLPMHPLLTVSDVDHISQEVLTVSRELLAASAA